jgi:hypothetical protein
VLTPAPFKMNIIQRNYFKLVKETDLSLDGYKDEDFINLWNGVKNIQLKKQNIDKLIEMLNWVKENEK